ncbi:MAG: DEAD/DEAH box helicase [Planctomycetota bacterium]
MPVPESPDDHHSSFLHGIWTGHAFHLFRIGATDAEVPASIQSAMGELTTDGLLASVGEVSSLELWLPTTDATSWNRQSVPTLAFGPADAIDLLTGFEDAGSLSDSLRYWAAIARFLVQSLARQQFAPNIMEVAENAYEGRWHVLSGSADELKNLEATLAAMPPVCRSVATGDRATMDPVHLIDSFLTETADAVIRRSLSRDDFFDDIHDRARTEGLWELAWLSSLLGKDRRIQCHSDEIAPIAPLINTWISKLTQEAEETPDVLRFRLVEPAEDASAEVWRLAIDLIDAEDRLVDVAAVLSDRGDRPSLLGRRYGNRRAQLVAELNRAGALFPPLTRFARRPSPDGLDLTNDEVYGFLRENAPMLITEGFSLDLPDWARNATRQLGLQLHLKPISGGAGTSDLSLGRFGLGALLEFDWRMALGDDRLTLEEFEEIAKQKSSLVKLRGQWISFDQEAATRALEFMRKEAKGKITLLAALRLVGGAEETAAGLPVIGISGADWLDQFLRDTPNSEVEELPQPAGFKGTLRPYQLRGMAWLAFLHRLGIGACLADDMGLGKTIQLISLLLIERERDREAAPTDVPYESAVGPTLLFAPMSVVGNWQREMERFAPTIRVLVHHGPQRLSGDAFIEATKQHDVIITTYGLAHRCEKDFKRIQWYRIAMDEAQKIKNPIAAQTVALRNLNADHRIALTGTPVENHLSELWSIMEVLNPGLLGTASSFRTKFAVPVEKLGDQQRADQLRRMIRPFLLRRLKSDPTVACDLPEKMEMRVFCNLTTEQAAIYERTVNALMNEVDLATGIRRRGMILATLTKLKQICNHPAHFLKNDGPLDGRSGKCERLIEMLEEVLEEGDAALVFTQYREMGNLLERLMAKRLGVQVPFLHGGTTMKKRNEMIDAFQDPANPQRIFLLSLKAGGFGLNLTKANHVFHFDRWWNPAVEDQATDRVHRIGQTRRVQVHKFVCIGTVEDRIDKLLTEKSALADRIVGSGDEWLTGMSSRDLRDYLTLTDDAVVES